VRVPRAAEGCGGASGDVQLSYVARLFGHKSIRATKQHYGHLVEDHVAETLRASIPSFS
jgi:site-specific recombinase XerD